jgi:hypothetical protein
MMNLQQEINYIKEQAVAEKVIEFFSRYKIEVLTYLDLVDRFKTLDDLFKKYPFVILHYPSSYDGRSGHYVAIWRYNNTFYHFCPYGMSIQQNIEKAHHLSLPQNKYKKNLFINMVNDFINKGGNIDINTRQIQKFGNDIATCSRHCLVRLKKYYMSNEQYYQFFNYKNMDKDDLVSLLTYFM